MSLFNRTGRGPAEMPFLDHLEELRWRVLWSMLALVVGSIAGYFIVTRLNVLEWLIVPVKPYLTDGQLTVLGPLDAFMLTLKLTITVGFILAFPIVAGQFWAFISPALHSREKRIIVPALYLGLVLFAGGVALGYYVVLPMTMKFGQQFLTGSLKTLFVADKYLSLVTKILIAFGAVFELPVVMLVLASFGLVSSKFLASKRRLAIAMSAVGAAVLTPGDAITVTVFMTGPLILLYELSIGLTRLVERRREKKALMPEPMPEAS
jgi:sec-independent protein translocase protein TatC